MRKGLSIKTVLFYLGGLLIILSISMLLPLGWSLYYQENLRPLLFSSLIAAVTGIVAVFLCRERGVVRYREAFALVTFSWVAAAIFGSLPYLLSGSLTNPVDAIFETISGFTTTGASVITDVESLPRGILFWRSMTHWLGGMGIIVLIVALLSQLGVGANLVFRAEVPGPVDDKLTPRVRETARILWLTYVTLSALETILLMLAGMNLFDALCHTFGTVATGGFSTKNQSVGAYSNPAIEWIIIVFMLLSGANFALYYRALNRRSLIVFWKDSEFKFYLTIILTAALVISAILGKSLPAGEALFRTAAFQVVSIMTTTGFATADFACWPAPAQLVLLFLMFIGGCSGSTGGAIKVGRILLLVKQSFLELKRLIHPRGIFSVCYCNRNIAETVLINVMQFFFLYIVIYAVCSLVLCFLEGDYLLSFSAVAATFGNVGPGLGAVGPASNYFALSNPSKLLLSFLMLLGRLEIYTIMVLLSPAFWKS